MKTGTRDHLSRQSGFSLIEIMVGMVIGMLGIIVMMQVYSTSEERKRTTTAGGDAQNNAAIALDLLQRDISRSGHGFSNINLLNCSIQLPNGTPIPLTPVNINPAAAVIPPGDANTDTLLIVYGVADDHPDGYSILNQSGTTYTIVGTGMVKQGDRTLASPLPCGAATLRLGTVQSVNASTIVLNTSAVGGALYNLGANPRFLAYAVRNGNLTVCDYMASNCGSNTPADLANQTIWRPIANNVVSLRAQYVHAASFDQTAPANCNAWSTTRAIRFALVTRSAQFEKDAVTAAAPTWIGSTATAGNTVLPIDLTMNTLANPAEWTHYRYRVFETMAPIRNVSWGTIGC